MEKWRTDLPRDDRPRSSGRRAWLVVPGVLLVALLAAFLVSQQVDDPADPDPAAPAAPAVVDDGADRATTADGDGGTTVTSLVRRPEAALRGAPAMRIHPQRAEAGAPLELFVEGEGCPGAGGTLSITEVGSARELGGADRLVVRRRFDVDAARRFRANPLLVGQPAATYRVSVACDRTNRAVTLDEGAGRRDTFVMSEVLELVGPGRGAEIEVYPALVVPGTATTVQVVARGCPASGRHEVEVVLFPANVGTPPATVSTMATYLDGAWRTSFSIAAEAAYGSYTVRATCRDELGVLFPFAVRTVRFGTAPLDEPSPPDTSRLRGVLSSLVDVIAPAAKPVPGAPTYTG